MSKYKPVPPRHHHEEPKGALSAGQIRYAVTWRGETKHGVTEATALAKAKRCLDEQREHIRETKGRFGLSYEFVGIGKAKIPNLVRASHQTWGFTHNRWTSANGDYLVLTTHLLRAERYRSTAPDCKHLQHGAADHVCEAFEVIEHGPERKQDLPRQLAKEAAALAAHTKDATQAKLDVVADIPETPFAEEPAETAPDPFPTATTPRQDGLLRVDIDAVLRDLTSLHRLGKTCFVHVHHRGGVLDMAVLIDPKGDEAVRLNQERSKFLGGASRPAEPVPRTFVNADTLATYYAGLGGVGAGATDAIAALGPWKPESFQRSRPDFRRWQEAYHDAFRGGMLTKELASRGYKFHQVTDPSDPTKFLRNQHGEDLWCAEKVTA